ncbi:hypothetical protein PY370_14400 [Lactiplantibacillus plantarum]|uniref:hypothetical protein n=1 Tax=Lactiplantibacillus plantarum TaxID=1590 RepID=UPI0034E0856D
MNKYPIHYILSYADGQMVEISLNQSDSEQFEKNQWHDIEEGTGCIIDHDRLGKRYYNRNIVSLLALDDDVFKSFENKNSSPKMKQIGFSLSDK